MPTTLITQRDEFECAYVLKMDENHTPLFNSHHYRIEVSVSGPQQIIDNGIIIEFAELKALMKSLLPDHQFIYCKNGSKGEQDIAAAFAAFGIPPRGYEFPPSAENLVQYFAESLQLKLNSKYPGVEVVDVKLRETANSFATWSKSGN